MFVEIVLSRETLATCFTFKWFFSGMDAKMSSTTATCGETHTTHCTYKHRLPVMKATRVFDFVYSLINIVLLCDIYFYKRVLVVIISSQSFYEMQLYSKSILCNQYVNLCTHKCHVCDCLVMFANTNICTPFMLFCSLLMFFLLICFSSALSIVLASMASFLKCF